LHKDVDVNCDKCENKIQQGEQYEHCGQNLCEDCYMDALSPTRICNPWLVHSAKTLQDNTSGELHLTELQSKIHQEVVKTGGVEINELRDRFGLDEAEFEKQIATLHHMEKIQAKKRDDLVMIEPGE
jgi:hypothetical protein